MSHQHKDFETNCRQQSLQHHRSQNYPFGISIFRPSKTKNTFDSIVVGNLMKIFRQSSNVSKLLCVYSFSNTNSKNKCFIVD